MFEELTDREHAILVGTLMGDGCLQTTGGRNGKNARLRLEHGLKQKDYLLWKAEELKGVSPGGKISFLSRVHPGTKETYHYARYQSWATLSLGELRRVFYPEGKKRVPAMLAGLLSNPLSLAVWYMDDGYYAVKDRAAYIYLGTVSREEAEIEQTTVAGNFGLEVKLYDKKQRGFALAFSAAETPKFFAQVAPYMLPLFNYKLS